MAHPRPYLQTLLLTVLASLAGVALVNLFVDPYGIYRLWSRGGINANKYHENYAHRMVRAHWVSRERPDALLLGTSRTQAGLDARSPHLRRLAERPLNVALSDGTPYEALRYLQHAHAQRPQTLAVMGLDFLSFDARAEPRNVEFREERMAVTAAGRATPWWRVADLPSTLLSVDALAASQRTVRKQSLPSYFDEGGTRRPESMAERIVEEGGMRATFLWSERDYMRRYACFVLRDGAGRSHPLESFRQLVALASREGIRLQLFFSPSHARSHLLVRELGLWREYEDWKRALLAVLTEEAHGREPFPLWDFSGADPRFTAEPVPPPGDVDSRMRWHYESSHYRPALGEHVLARMLDEPGSPEVRGFGVRLTPGNLEQELGRIRAEVEGYAAAHPDEAAELRALAREVVEPARRQAGCTPLLAAQPVP